MVDAEHAVRAYLDSVASRIRRRDAQRLLELMTRITGQPAHLWGTSIIGFGSYHYRYASGREGDAPAAGFSPRKAATTVYLGDGVGAHADELTRLGEHTAGVGCLYLKDLDRVDLAVLQRIVASSYHTLTSGVYGHRAHESDRTRHNSV
jgi:hypothetical protein